MIHRHLIALLLIVCSGLSTHLLAAPFTNNGPYDGSEVTSMMDQQKLTELFPEPYHVGDLDPELALWPLYKTEVTGLNLIGYIYESINYSAIPGFMGIPYNLLVVIDPHGSFVEVRVLFHREPMFIGGVGEAPMDEFVKQYSGLSLMQNIKFNDNQGQRKPSDENNVYLDGISGATASIRILNQTLLSSALKVARARLGFGTDKDPDLIAKIDYNHFEHLSWQDMQERGLINHAIMPIDQAVEKLKIDPENWFDGSPSQAIGSGFISLYVLDLAIPSVGRNLLSATAWQFLSNDLNPGDHAFLVVSQGLYSFVHENTLRGGISDRLILRQEGLPIEMRDMDFEERVDLSADGPPLILPALLEKSDWLIYRVISTSGIDISLPLDFELAIVKDAESPYFSASADYFNFQAVIPKPYYYEPAKSDKTWLGVWKSRVWEILLLVFGLAILTYCLARQQWLTKTTTKLNQFRLAYLLFTLFFIGWYAQGQLSIVNITGLLQALLTGRDLTFFLYDPMTLVLWGYVLATLFIWGRGTFCGWLCPFGALQELTTKALRVYGLRAYEPSKNTDRKLKKIKYGLLASILIAASVSPMWTDRLVEIEPFKTSITFYFVRYWPFTLWAVLAVVSSVFIYKGYCRYICPLGAALAMLGNLRRFDWIARRIQCGAPCQLCKNSCAYDSIESNGRIQYSECFQCLDCVSIYHNDTLCAPLIIEKRATRKRASAQQPQYLIASTGK